MLRPIVRHTIVVTVLLGLVGGCHDGDVTPPRTAAPATASRDVDTDHRGGGGGVSPISCTPHPRIVGSGTFGPSGGTLAVGEARLFIPGGALRDTVTITGTWVGDGTSTVRFSPHGLRFHRAVGLSLSTSGCSVPSEGEASIVYLDDEGAILEQIEAVYMPRFKSVAAPIWHFSGYAIAF